MLSLTVANLEMRFPGLAAPALRIDRLHVSAGTRLAITGASGSGKTTLVNAITGLETVKTGKVAWGDTTITDLSGRGRDRFRAGHIGLVMQDFHLFPGLSAFDNVVLPLRLSRRVTASERQRALHLLDATGIGRPAQKIETLSRGEMQRVAVARALLASPGVIVADEPTASLDRRTGDEVAALLLRLSKEEGATLVVVSHDPSLTQRLDRHIHIENGRIVEDSAVAPTPC